MLQSQRTPSWVRLDTLTLCGMADLASITFGLLIGFSKKVYLRTSLVVPGLPGTGSLSFQSWKSSMATLELGLLEQKSVVKMSPGTMPEAISFHTPHGDAVQWSLSKYPVLQSIAVSSGYRGL